MVEYISIYDRPKKKTGRPKGTCKFTDEERKERVRIRSKSYYDANAGKERERKRLEYQAKKELFKIIFIYSCCIFIF